MIQITAYDLAMRFVGLKEVPGSKSNPMVLGMLQLDTNWPTGDAVPWCSAFMNFIAWMLRLPRSKDLRARSWLTVGRPISLAEAVVGFDVVILNRGGSMDPTEDGPGHVGWFAGMDHAGYVLLLAGNQGDSVSLARFSSSNVLGVRRLA